MRIDKKHGRSLSATLSARGALIIQQSGVIFMAAYHGIDLPLDGYELEEAERSARDVLDAVDTYRTLMRGDPVITHPRPSYHRPAEGLRAEDVLPDERYRYSGDVRGEEPEPLPDEAEGRRIMDELDRSRVLPLATLDALNSDGPDEAA